METRQVSFTLAHTCCTPNSPLLHWREPSAAPVHPVKSAHASFILIRGSGGSSSEGHVLAQGLIFLTLGWPFN